jgi:hypothetical protein
MIPHFLRAAVCWVRGHRWSEVIHDTWNGMDCTRRECLRCGRSYPITLIATTPTTASFGGICREKGYYDFVGIAKALRDGVEQCHREYCTERRCYCPSRRLLPLNPRTLGRNDGYSHDLEGYAKAWNGRQRPGKVRRGGREQSRPFYFFSRADAQ